MPSMRQSLCLAVILVFGMGLVLTAATPAEAKRFGSRRSIGSSPAPSRNYSTKTSTAKQRHAVSSTRRSVRRPGGLFGSLVAGTLIGSLFMGGPFMGPSLLDLVLIGLLVFFVVRLFKGRGTRGPSSKSPPRQDQRSAPDRFDTAAAGWEHLRSKPAGGPPPPEPTDEEESIPQDFDTQEFLKGAKIVYQRLQEAWDDRDLEDIRGFTTPEVFREIRRQAKEDPNTSQTEIVLLQAEVRNVRRDGAVTHVSVAFEALLRESPQDSETRQVRELWHFQRDESRSDSHWLLEGLEQLPPSS
ncbi:Tim44 domain-containing protein [Desulfohalobium retbaense]|uniref:Import inner membrane translocase subunit Tim44 n=1 Tax=Desulfohalobium retbaense (strain ATCC 49708 / DSM 5692 / JCM 16813 / HR100) TaxID=485915 RepID=C8X275_DESRD|nr:TIM44-like domain-containing protein [Desulfohalobium retbaense]ACV68398.1 import inner membrane translocase subunit Tim44 [Desulfohalobium retbaense DSM 5692]